MHPSLLYANLFDFHGSTLATTFLLFMLWGLEDQRPRAYWQATVLVLLSSEVGGVSVALVGLLTWCAGRRRLGALTMAAGVLGLALATVVMRACNHGLPSAYAALYGDASPLERLFSHDGLAYTVGLLGPLVFLPVLSPARLIPALPFFLGNLLSWRESQCSLHFHYGASILPFLMWAAPRGYARLCLLSASLPSMGAGTVLIGTRGCVSLALLALALGVAWVRGPLEDDLPPREWSRAAATLAVVPPPGLGERRKQPGREHGRTRRAVPLPQSLRALSVGQLRPGPGGSDGTGNGASGSGDAAPGRAGGTGGVDPAYARPLPRDFHAPSRTAPASTRSW